MFNKNFIHKLLNNPIFKGTFILSLSGILCRFLGLYYKVFLSANIGAKGIGLYQLIFPVMTLGIALCTSGITAAISRFSSKSNNANEVLCAGSLISVSLALFFTIIVFNFSDYIATFFLMNKECSILLKIMSLCIPFCSLRECIKSYYYSTKNSNIPALTLLIEQIIRIFFIISLVNYLKYNNFILTPIVAVLGLFVGESASCMFILISLFRKGDFTISFKHFKNNKKNIIQMSFPLTLNRVLITFLTMIEAVLIPANLMSYGLNSNDALSVYGALTGMAISFITFPATIFQSAAVLLLPSVSKKQSAGNLSSIRYVSKLSILSSFLIGFSCALFFLTIGADFSELIFKDTLVKSIVKALAFSCPFIYTNTIINSIINGLGKTNITFITNIFATGIRLLFITIAIPNYGISGYMYGLLLSNFFVTIVYLLYLNKLLKLKD